MPVPPAEPIDDVLTSSATPQRPEDGDGERTVDDEVPQPTEAPIRARSERTNARRSGAMGDALLETGRRRARKIAKIQDVPEALRRIGGHVSHRLQLFDSDAAGNPISWGFLFGYSRNSFHRCRASAKPSFGVLSF
jgi:hypothetical protein